MKKAILISIRPEWVEKILNGEKTIEVRKFMPRCGLPIDVYIYCTKGKTQYLMVGKNNNKTYLDDGGEESVYSPNHNYIGNGKIVAKFTLNKVDKYRTAYVNPKSNQTYRFTKYGLFINEDKVDYTSWEKNENVEELLKKSCLNANDIHKYAKTGKLEDLDYGYFYAWHIDNLQIFDKPMELNQFYTYCSQVKNVKEHKGSLYINDVYKPLNYSSNPGCRKCKYYDDDFNICRQPNNVTRPPQSWQYVFVKED